MNQTKKQGEKQQSENLTDSSGCEMPEVLVLAVGRLVQPSNSLLGTTLLPEVVQLYGSTKKTCMVNAGGTVTEINPETLLVIPTVYWSASEMGEVNRLLTALKAHNPLSI